jgi:hypothetical protein
MRIILGLCFLIIIAGVAILVVTLRGSNHFGAAFVEAPKVAVRDLVKNPTEFLGKQVIIEGDVIDQCPATGCFFYFDDGGQRLKVELSDLAQSLPQRTGAKARVEGQLVPYGSSYQFLGSAVEFK